MSSPPPVTRDLRYSSLPATIPGIPTSDNNSFDVYRWAKITGLHDTETLVVLRWRPRPSFGVCCQLLEIMGWVRDPETADIPCSIPIRDLTGQMTLQSAHIQRGDMQIDGASMRILLKLLAVEPTPKTPSSLGAYTNVDIIATWGDYSAGGISKHSGHYCLRSDLYLLTPYDLMLTDTA
ncbi:hypothetical protein BO71DRAFT_140452 [Aspergillus ellipticus CBS 707.79]|uniref:Uncharacterized protein n=1 Tax=Aspergillus ellipticus CBS 707.79 TaxID=1448320 RepID=A0A319E0S6_9EURO|nr:hypothetical protein BO71DRAFT_140452 [Aspergillus ellipticus CBS 707.79]